MSISPNKMLVLFQHTEEEWKEFYLNALYENSFHDDLFKFLGKIKRAGYVTQSEADKAEDAHREFLFKEYYQKEPNGTTLLEIIEDRNRQIKIIWQAFEYERNKKCEK